MSAWLRCPVLDIARCCQSWKFMSMKCKSGWKPSNIIQIWILENQYICVPLANDDGYPNHPFISPHYTCEASPQSDESLPEVLVKEWLFRQTSMALYISFYSDFVLCVHEFKMSARALSYHFSNRLIECARCTTNNYVKNEVAKGVFPRCGKYVQMLYLLHKSACSVWTRTFICFDPWLASLRFS